MNLLKAISLVMILFFALAGTASAGHWMNAGEYGLKGHVRTISEQQHLTGKDGRLAVVPVREVSYDLEGKAVRVISYKGPSSFSDRGYQYDAQGRLAVSGSYNKDGVYTAETLYFYDTAGRLTETRFVKEDGLVFLSKTYLYDQSGKLTEEMHFSNGMLITDKKYVVDSERNEVVTTTYGPDGRLLATERASYSGKGAESLECVYDGELSGYGKRQRNTIPDGDTASSVCYLPDGSVYQNRICETIEDGNKKRTVHRADGSVMTETYYDAAGNSKAFTSFNLSGEIEKAEKYIYQYDEEGNWVERTVLERLDNQAEWKVREKTLRTISYYQ